VSTAWLTGRPADAPPKPRVVVVGAGIAGLAAAHALLVDGRVDVTVIEGAPRTGGKLVRGSVAGVTTDLGAESVLARRPEGIGLIAELGLDSVHPQTTSAAIWSRGTMRALPAGQVMGVPTSVRSLAASRVVSAPGVLRASADLALPRTPVDGDTSVAAYVGARLGREVVDRLVEPLLGGVYAGRADELSLRATLPQVAAVSGERSLMRALRAPKSVASGPVFAGLEGGVGRLAESLTEAIQNAGASVMLGSPARELEPTATGWRLVTGSAAAPSVTEADAVVLALPAAPASRLLATCVPVAARELAAIEYASMAVVSLAFSAGAFEKPLSGSGFLVPAVEGRLIKAVTFSSQKWGWYPAGVVLVRCSVGRYRDVADLLLSDDELVGRSVRELAAAVGVTGAPRDAVVTRWGGGLPQYAVGHLDRVERINDAIGRVDRLAACGAAYGGVGIPACIGSGQAAATQILRGLFPGGQ
jgi:protoporphyrinogen oxidase